jgi:hypothetical protein
MTPSSQLIPTHNTKTFPAITCRLPSHAEELWIAVLPVRRLVSGQLIASARDEFTRVGPHAAAEVGDS